MSEKEDDARRDFATAANSVGVRDRGAGDEAVLLTPTPKEGEEDGRQRPKKANLDRRPVVHDGGDGDVSRSALTPSPQDSIGGLVERLRSDYPIEAEEETPHLVIETYKEDRQEAADALEDLRLGIQCAKARNKQLAESNAVLLENGREDQETIAALRSALEKIEKGSTAYANAWQREIARAALEGWETVKPGEWPLEDVKPLTGEGEK